MMLLAIAAFLAAYMTLMLSIKRHSLTLDLLGIALFVLGLVLLFINSISELIEVFR